MGVGCEGVEVATGWRGDEIWPAEKIWLGGAQVWKLGSCTPLSVGMAAQDPAGDPPPLRSSFEVIYVSRAILRIPQVMTTFSA